MNAAGGIAMLIGYLVGSLVIGALLGLIPFFLGRRRGADGLGTAGLICCIISNLFGLGIVAAIIFVIIILIKG